MHCMNMNIPKHLYKLWDMEIDSIGGRVRGMRAQQWEAINKDIKESKQNIPLHVCRAPRLTSQHGNYTSADWVSFFQVYAAPALVRHLPTLYAENFLRFRELVRITQLQSFTPTAINELQHRVVDFVRQFETMFYNSKPDQMWACTIQIHSLLHVASNIRDFGSPIYYWQYAMERFLRSFRMIAKSPSEKFRSIQINLLSMEYMRHANFVKHVDPYANMVLQPDEFTAGLIHPTGKPLEEEWQGRLSRAGTGRQGENTGTQPSNMIVYQACRLSNGHIVATLDSEKRTLHRRRRAYIMFAHERDLCFALTIHFIRDPADNSEWACVRRLRVSPLPRPQGDSARLLPAPRQVFDFNNTHTHIQGAQDFMWIPIDRIIDSVGIVTTHGERGEWNGQRHWIVDKEGLSESSDYIQSLL